MQIGEALIIAQHNVEARPMLLDEVVLEEQRLGIRVGDRYFHVYRFGDQRLDFGLDIARLKVG